MAEVKDAASSFLRPRDAVRRKQLIGCLRGNPPRITLISTTSYAIAFIAEHSRGNMSSVAVWPFLSECPVEVR